MSLADKVTELTRLRDAFESEASKFPPLTLTIMFIGPDATGPDRPTKSPNHAVMLWQYYGNLKTGEFDQLINDLKASNMQYGLRGCKVSAFAVLEGDGCELFVRMASRAGAIFDDEETRFLSNRLTDEIAEAAQRLEPDTKPILAENRNPLAAWINFLLYHLSLVKPDGVKTHRIDPEPFTLSLLAIERLLKDRVIGKVDRSVRRLAEIDFRVALSFPGERRAYVTEVADALRPQLPPDSLFYDYDYQAQLARPNLDVVLQDIYRNRSKLIVVFLCQQYGEKEWCGLEWRAVRDIIKAKKDEQVMFVRFDNAQIEGVFSIDGYVDANRSTPKDLAQLILERLKSVD